MGGRVGKVPGSPSGHGGRPQIFCEGWISPRL
uniref:Uncharacterized protein n=1 Tax=Rhizophora mucronata TaxID=61149 RepID=A0A2P2N0B0_RHIMU